MATTLLFAQDLIVTNDAQKIEAKILEVSKTEIRYKEKDNLDGPTFVLETKEISSIIYANGKVMLYNKQLKQEQTSTQPTKAISNTSSSSNSGARIYRENGQYMYKNMYISGAEVSRILAKENELAYNYWKKGNGMAIGSAICLGAGGGLLVGGLISTLYRTTYFNNRYQVTLGLTCSSIVPIGIGIGLLAGSYANCNKAINIYNSKYDQVAVQLKWQVALDGVGLAIAF